MSDPAGRPGGAHDTAPVRLVLTGASGRMGREILRLLPGMPRLRLSGAVASAGSRSLGQDAGTLAGTAALGVPIGASLAPLLAAADLVIDFSNGTAVAATLAACVEARVPLLIGTTGFGAGLEAALTAAAQRIALLVAPNTSLGVNVLLELVRQAARSLPADYDVEIVEVHHRHKLDAPSGTALALGAAVAEARGERLEASACYGRQGRSGERPAGQIGFAALRGGEGAGEHEVLFLGSGERLSLAHRAEDRSIFARGALLAGLWLAGQPPGGYAMRDFLSYTTKS